MTLERDLLRAAAHERDELVRFNLNLIAGEVAEAVAAFAATPSTETLTTLNGHWSHGVQMLGIAAERRSRGVA